MEIFQTVWNALTNENEVAMFIICTPLTFLEVFLYMELFLTVLKIDSTFMKRLIFVLSFSILSILTSYIIPIPYYTFINVISMPIFVFFIFKVSILKAVLSEAIVYVVLLILSPPMILLYSAILGVSSYATATIPIHKLFFSLLLYIALFLFITLWKKHTINISLLDDLKKKKAFLIILNLLIGSIAVGIEFYILFNYIDYIPNSLVFFSLCILLLYVGISIFSIYRTNKLELTTRSLEEQKMYNKTLSTLHDNIRGFKHDFNNIIQAIGGYLSTNNIDGLKEYYKDLLEECQINNNLAVLNPELINNPAVYSLLADKYYKSESTNIKLNLEVMTDLSNLNIKIYELTRILGVLLDNAIEAASKCDKKIVNVIFRDDKSHNKTLIIIQNTYSNKGINIDRIFEKGYTSKSDNLSNKNHGLGLWEVRNYLKKHTNLDLYTTKNDDYFTQQFEIYN